MATCDGCGKEVNTYTAAKGRKWCESCNRKRINVLRAKANMAPLSDSRRRSPRRTGLLGLNFGKSVRFG